MPMSTGRIGIDIGAMYLKAVRLSPDGVLQKTHYARHRESLRHAFRDALDAVSFVHGDAIGFTGVSCSPLAEVLGLPVLDLVRCQLAGLAAINVRVTDVIDIGGCSCTLVQLDEHGEFQGFTSNSLCAAGTGSFLDEQALRLGITNEDIAAFAYTGEVPSIAARCSVFAKSDLIHRQQEGYPRTAMWSGLCRSMAGTMLSTLLNGRPLTGLTAVIGGVAQNTEVVRWLKSFHGDLIVVPEQPHLVAARGAALLGAQADLSRFDFGMADSVVASTSSHYPWPLTMERSVYPAFDRLKTYADDNGNEVRLSADLSALVLPVYMGIDIGSTSSKVLLMGSDEQVVVDIYRKTAGDPIYATRQLFRTLSALEQQHGVTWDILGVGITGSGRKMVGEIIGADEIINEITAHVAGAVHFDPEVETIFEIGGQDSKYMHVVDGHIRDSSMNYVCAAGTGSFVEEQAQKLGYAVGDVGAAVLGLTPPQASDRCTVFMEQDVVDMVQAGLTREQALASVMVSVVKNFLNKVVVNRHYSREKIFFQGATARNPALVAAFERVLGVQIVVSPFCHVMGAYGVALLTRRAMTDGVGKRTSVFRGLGIESSSISLRKDVCDLCQNSCTITCADIAGIDHSPTWGYLCGREPEEKSMRVNRQARYLLLRRKLLHECSAGVSVPADAPVVGIPHALTTHTFLPTWRRFFNELGYRVQLSPGTDQEIRDLGTRLCGGEFCFPAKVALGHVAWLAKEPDIRAIFLPQLGNEKARPHVTASAYCPYVQGWPAYTRSALLLNGIPAEHILSPVIDRRMPEKKLVGELVKSLGTPLKRSTAAITRAWRLAVEAQQEFEHRMYEEGDKALADAEEKGERLLVLIGRPYNMSDSGLNLDIPAKIAERGLTVLPMDFLRPQYHRLNGRYSNVYWAYGQKIIAVLEQVAASGNLDAVYLTNFNCGPDSFLLTYAEEIMGNRPFLALELDEHGGDAGYLTRVEAFLDVLRRPQGKTAVRSSFRPAPDDMRERTIWIPPMHDFGTDFFTASFRRHGYDGRVLPVESRATFELGRSLTRGSECLPTALTIGALVTTLRDRNLSTGQAFFMPTTSGPCRFGQYCQLHRQILDREGYQDVAILSPSSVNAYQGVDDQVRRLLFKSMVLSDILLKARCKVRPYELEAGRTDLVVAEERDNIAAAIEGGKDLCAVVRAAVARLASIPRTDKKRPLVGVVGEIYVRNNAFANENLIATIESLGGEAWPAPLAEWIMYLASPRNFLQYMPGPLNMAALKSYATFRWQQYWEHRLYSAAGYLVTDRREPDINDVLDEAEFYMARNIGGEAMSIIGRSIKFAEQGAALVVNCAPFGCMPGTITTAVLRHVSQRCGIPVVNMFYDGQGNQNRRLRVFLNNAVKRQDSMKSTGVK